MKALRALVASVGVLVFGGFIATLVLFLTRNDHWVVVRFPLLQLDWSTPILFKEWEARLWLVITGSAAAGALLLAVLLLPGWLRRAVERRRERRFIGALEHELTDLRNLPVNDPAPLEDIAEDEAPAMPGGARRDQRSVAGAIHDDEESAALIATLEDPPPRPEPGR